MTTIVWDEPGERVFEAGVDRGVLYVTGQPGVPWNGLISVSENPSGGSPTPYYFDGVKYLNVPSREEYGSTIEAFTYPDEFSICDGKVMVRNGLYVQHQPRKPFGLSYRTKIGNDVSGIDYGYQIHLIYGALATPSKKDYKSLSDTVATTNFSWDVSLLSPDFPGYLPTGHLIIDSREINPSVLSAIELMLYGSADIDPQLPPLSELIDMIDADPNLTVVDNGDGTFTVSSPVSAVIIIDSNTFEIDSSAVTVDADLFSVVSL